MFRTAIAAIATIAATAMVPQATAQPGARPLDVPASQWAVVQVGEQKVSHCVMGLRSNAGAPERGQPQFMILADDQFAILRVRAAEWSFTGGRDLPINLIPATGHERKPAAAVRGPDMIDIAFGVEPERLDELAAASHLDIQVDGVTVRLPLKGLAVALPAYRDCLAGIGQPAGRMASAALTR
jgi:hypothetical protein